MEDFVSTYMPLHGLDPLQVRHCMKRELFYDIT